MEHTVLLGGYTKRDSQGIYQANLVSDQLTTVTPFVHVEGPTYFQVSQQNKLYTIAKKDDLGGLAVYDLNKPEPQLIASYLTPGPPPAYVGISEEFNLIFTANYHRGTITLYQIEADGTLSLKDSVEHEGSSIKPEQTKAHPHYADLTPDNRLAVADLGCDGVFIYDIDFETYHLTLHSHYQTAQGFGPRHLVFNTDYNLLYVLGELSSQVAILRYTDGELSHLETVETIPDDHTDHNGAAAILISKDNRFLYTSNRGHNSICVFEISNEGQTLTEIQTISTEGDFPRDFNWDADQTRVIVANQNSDNATLFNRDEKTGRLSLIEKDVAVPEATRVLFRD
ncbi:lactonase family protein [Holzapfeliella sp. He02]|uniref:Lactonase family protein n=1 Tax=Holzapfeliella saturejae TaxID=3082953 RepID=A0ABU8SFM8_9LACO